VGRAFSMVVGRTRLRSSVWAGLSVVQPVVMLVVVFASGETCSAILIATGVVMMLLGAVAHVWFRPHRIVAANYLQGIGMCLNAAVLMVASKLVGDPLHTPALDANRAIAMIQLSLSVCRFVHTVWYLCYMRLYHTTVLTRCNSDGSFPSSPDAIVDPLCSPCIESNYVFDVQCAFCRHSY
jgi:predicted membrane channel-forming protein YqfA (hemolysin III family)